MWFLFCVFILYYSWGLHMFRALERGDYDTDPDDERFRGVEPKRHKGFVSEAWKSDDVDRAEILWIVPLMSFIWPILYVWMAEGRV
jgi:hypothetical protein